MTGLVIELEADMESWKDHLKSICTVIVLQVTLFAKYSLYI